MTHTFKTNINCGGCVAKVTPVLDHIAGIKTWEVDTSVPEKILTVDYENISAEDIIKEIKKLGFSIEEK